MVGGGLPERIAAQEAVVVEVLVAGGEPEDALGQEVAAWVAERNRVQAKIVWTFRVADARRKLDFLYPEELVR